MQIATSPTPMAAGWLIGIYGIHLSFFVAAGLTLLGAWLLMPLKLFRGTKG